MPKELHTTTGAQCGAQHEKLIRKIKFERLEGVGSLRGSLRENLLKSFEKGVATRSKEI